MMIYQVNAKAPYGLFVSLLFILLNLTFPPSSISAAEIISDDFNSTGLNTDLWQFVDPLDDGSVAMTGSQVSISVPAGTAHNVWTGGNFAPRIIQDVDDTDFVIEVKFDSLLSEGYQMEGVLIGQDDLNYLRLDFFNDGSDTRIYCAAFSNGQPTTINDETISSGSPLYMRVDRAGDLWTQSYSTDGSSWTELPGFTFAMQMNTIGIFAGNAGGNPAFSMLADYFLNISDFIAPTITVQPTDQTVTEGQTATFSITAAGTAPLIYQWQKDGEDIIDATDASYTTPATTMDDDGAVFTCTVTNDYGAVLSDSASLTVLTVSPEIVSDDFNAASLNTDLWQFIDPVGDGSVAMTGSQVSIFVPAGTAHNVWTGGNFAPRIIQYVDDTDFEIKVKFDSLLSEGYQMEGVLVGQDDLNFLRFDFFSDGSDTRIYCAAFSNGQPTEINDEIISSGSPLYMRIDRAGDLWTQSYSTDGSSWTELPGFTFAMQMNTIGIFAGNAGGNPAFSMLADYFLNISDFIGPTITVQPTDQTVTEGQTATFSITAAGTAPLSYQWQKDGEDIIDATDASYTTPATTMDDDGAVFTCTVTNDYSSVTSDPATLTVDAAASAPTITEQPSNQTVTEGQTATFSITAIGTAPLSYQWQKDGGNIVDATDASYTTPITTLDDDGTVFTCIVTNAYGSVTSDAATLTVLDSNTTFNIWYAENQGNQIYYQAFGQIGVPQRWINILGNVSDPDGLASLTYTLRGGSENPLTIGPDARRLQSSGDFNVEIAFSDLNPSPDINEIIITAMDSLGNSSQVTVNVEYYDDTVWPSTYTVNWNEFSKIDDASQIVDGLWELENGNVRTVIPGYDRLIAIGDVLWEDYEITVPITIHALITGNTPGVGILLRWSGHYAWSSSQPTYGWYPMGALGWYRYIGGVEGARLRMIGGESELDIEDSSGKQLTFGVPYVFKIRVETLSGVGSRYSLKVWEQGTVEPSDWDLVGDEDFSSPLNGSLLFLAHNADASFGSVSVVPVYNNVEPSITVQPSDQTVTEGDVATFSVTAVGTTPISYQWQRDGEDITDATNADYTTPATTLDDSGAEFVCIVSNAFGSVTSDTATLTVNSSGCPDTDQDGLDDCLEADYCTDPYDADTDDDGIIDGIEDYNQNASVDDTETDPCNDDTDGDGIQDGTEMGLNLDDISSDTDTSIFQPDMDTLTTTNPLLLDTDGDTIPDGFEDINKNGRVDTCEPDPSQTTFNIEIDFDSDGDVDGIDIYALANNINGNFSSECVLISAEYIGYTKFPADPDNDGILSDGDFSGQSGDNNCTSGSVDLCDDNCPGLYNPSQADSDGDGIGDICE